LATGNFLLDKGYDALGAIGKNRAVRLVSEETVSQVTLSAQVVLGVSQFGVTADEILAGKGASVRRDGRTEWECGAAVPLGSYVMADTLGRAIVATAGNPVAGMCDGDASTAAGEYISVDLDAKRSVA